jgi:PPM family protein phosphatase
LGSKKITYDGFTYIGKRKKQEDSMAVSDDDTVFVISDGVGGEANGKLVSQFICNYFITHSENIRNEQSLQTLIVEASHSLEYWARENQIDQGAATLVLLKKINECDWLACNIGDSRIYLLDLGNKVLNHSRDHSLVYELFENGLINEDAILSHSMRNQITKAFKIGNLLDPQDPRMYRYSLFTSSQCFLLCSDGLWEIMSKEIISNVLNFSNFSELTEYLNLIITDRSRDNASYWLVT